MKLCAFRYAEKYFGARIFAFFRRFDKSEGANSDKYPKSPANAGTGWVLGNKLLQLAKKLYILL